jgi:hypothetical protein
MPTTNLIQLLIDHSFVVHGYLLGLAVFSTAIVAAGIVWENGPSRVREVANKLVIWGVAAEALCTIALFVFDEGISGKQQSELRQETEFSSRLQDHLLVTTQQLLESDQRLLEAVKQIAELQKQFPSPPPKSP